MGPNLAAALVAAQAELRAVPKDATNPEFRSSYTTLDAMIAHVRPVLAKHGLAVLQGAVETTEGRGVTVATTIIHTSGEEFTSGVYMPLVGRMMKGGARGEIDPQAGGSALSYGRRYGLAATLCLATGDDDDGAAASKPAPSRAMRPATPRSAPGPVSGPPIKELPPSPPISKWLGLAKDRPIPFGGSKGKALGEHSKKELETWQTWCVEHSGTEDLLHDIRVVLADIALGEIPASGVPG